MLPLQILDFLLKNYSKRKSTETICYSSHKDEGQFSAVSGYYVVSWVVKTTGAPGIVTTETHDQ